MNENTSTNINKEILTKQVIQQLALLEEMKITGDGRLAISKQVCYTNFVARDKPI